MHKDSLFQTINSGNKVIAENGNKCIISLIENVKSDKFINSISEELNSKNKNMREKISKYIVQIITIYDVNSLDKYSNSIENVINKGL